MAACIASAWCWPAAVEVTAPGKVGRSAVALAVLSRLIPGLTRTTMEGPTLHPRFELVLVMSKVAVAILAGLTALGLRSKVRR